jgi:hypothetical protein
MLNGWKGSGLGKWQTDMNFEAQFLITLGGILLLGLATDMLGRKTFLPRITLLLIFGVLIGQHGLDLIPESFSDDFDIIADMTLLIVGFLIGGKLAENYGQKTVKKVIIISALAAVGTTVVVFAGLGVYWGIYVGDLSGENQALYAVNFALVGALVGLIITPYISTRPVRALRGLLSRVSSQTLVSGFIGLIAGLLVAALLAFPLSALPSPFGEVLPFVGVLLFGYLGIAVFIMRKDDIFSVFRMNLPGRAGDAAGDLVDEGRTILLDTSVIIDGRIADICETGFLEGTLVAPQFVLRELQQVADSSDSLKRNRGRRGLDVL